MRGCYGGITGGRVDVFLYSPIRRAQDLESDTKAGYPYVGEPGLIVVPEVTLPYMEAAVEQSYKRRYFEHFVHSDGPRDADRFSRIGRQAQLARGARLRVAGCPPHLSIDA